MSDVGAAVLRASDQAWERLAARLAGLTDDEHLWEPVPDCWSLRRADDGVWRLDGDGGDGGPAGAPDPPPFTTLAWRLAHVRLSFIGFGDRMFRDGATTLQDVPFSPDAGGALRALHEDWRSWWREPLGALDEAAWSRPIGSAFGVWASSSTTDLALHVLDELVHHGGEVGVLRDLYRCHRGPA